MKDTCTDLSEWTFVVGPLRRLVFSMMKHTVDGSEIRLTS